MIRLVITLGTILYFNLFIVVLFNTKFGKALPVTYVSLILMLFISSLLGKLSYFKYLLLISIVLISLYYLWKVKNKTINLNHIKANYFRMSTVAFVLFFVYLYYTLLNVRLSNIDDFLHWGAMAKDIIRNDVLYTNTQYVLVKPGTYPPFATLLCGVFNKLLGGYSESWSLLGMSSFMFACFVGIIDKCEIKKQHILASVISFVTLVLLTLCIHQNKSMVYQTFFYNCTYVDWLLGVLIAYGLYTIYKFEYRSVDYLSLSISIIGLSLTKQTGLPFCLLIVVTLFVKIIADRRIQRNGLLLFAIFAIAIPVVIYIVWQIYMKQFNDYYAIDSSLNVVGGAASAIAGNQSLQDWQIITFFNCLKAFILKPVMIHPIELSYIPIVLICSVIILMVNYKNNDNRIISIFYFLGGIGYALVLLMSYTMLFGESEGPGLIMYGRYAQTYTYAGLLLVFWIFLEKLNYTNVKQLVFILLVATLFVEPNSVDDLIVDRNKMSFRQDEINKIEQYVQNEYNYQNILIVNQTDMAYRTLIRYTFAEKCKNATFYQFIDNSEFDIFTNYLSENEYILIGDYNDIFYDDYWSAISKVPLYNSTLYRIIKNDDKVEFEMIYTWEE